MTNRVDQAAHELIRAAMAYDPSLTSKGDRGEQLDMYAAITRTYTEAELRAAEQDLRADREGGFLNPWNEYKKRLHQKR